MNNQNDKVDRFAEEINKTAMNQCRKIQKHTEKFKSSELKKLEEDAKNRLEEKLRYEEETMKTKLNREISALAASGKSDVIGCRNQIMQDVFDKTLEKLIDFTKTDAYTLLLEKSIASLTDAFDEDVIIFVKESDKEKAEEICKNNPKVSAVKVSEKIKIGLAFASNLSETVFADDTLERRLEQQKEQFMADSGLTI